ncbi:MAG: TetR/AcrR family transcriptional regulator [candidate division Zixibacteria bacterium]|nr:TetR/AcrR family transcriptional regulator [candidate division Zixibacteria bacterium]
MNKEELILVTGRKLFSQFGLKKVTTEDIAKSAHVSKATVYRYYGNKSEIFEKVVRLEAEELLKAIRQAIKREHKVIDKFKAHLRVRFEKIRELVNLYWVTHETWGDFWPHLAGIGDWFQEEEEKIVKEVMIFGNETGELEVERVDLASHITVTVLKSIELPWALAKQGLTASEYIDILMDMIINGIGKNKLRN